MIYPLLPAFVTGVLGGGALSLGALDGAADFAAAFVKYGSGRLADKPRRRGALVILGYLVAVVVRPVIALAGAAWQVIGLRVTDRVGKGIRTPPRDALIADVTPSDAARPGVRRSARAGSCRRRPGPARRLLAADVAGAGRPGGDRGEHRPGDRRAGAGGLGGCRRTEGRRDDQSGSSRRIPIRPRPRAPAGAVRHLRLLSPSHARDPDTAAHAAARRLGGLGVVAVGGAARGALVVQLRRRRAVGPVRAGARHVARLGELRGDRLRVRPGGRTHDRLGVVSGARRRRRAHREPRAGDRVEACRGEAGNGIRNLSRRDRDRGARGRPDARRAVSGVERDARLHRERCPAGSRWRLAWPAVASRLGSLQAR